MTLGREDVLGSVWYPRRRSFSWRRFQQKVERAHEMRQHPTDAEREAWNLIREVAYSQSPKVIFFRQSVFGGYILDFFSPELGLGIEIDGPSHDARAKYDTMRDTNLERYGIHIIRFRNREVWHEPEEMKSKLLRIIKRLRRKNDYRKETETRNPHSTRI